MSGADVSARGDASGLPPRPRRPAREGVLLVVWLPDLLGTLNHEHGPGQDARIGRRAVPGIGEAPVLRQALPDDLLRRAPVQDALPAGVVGSVETLEQSLQVAA